MIVNRSVFMSQLAEIRSSNPVVGKKLSRASRYLFAVNFEKSKRKRNWVWIVWKYD